MTFTREVFIEPRFQKCNEKVKQLNIFYIERDNRDSILFAYNLRLLLKDLA